MLVLFVAIAPLLLVVAEYFGFLSSRTPSTPKWPASWWMAFLAASYGVQLAIVAYAAHHQYPVQSWRSLLPIAVVDDRGLATQNADVLSAVMLALAVLQSYALLGLYRCSIPQRTVWIACAIMLGMSVAAPAIVSFDPYYYVIVALRGRDAYLATNPSFTGEYHVIDLWWPANLRSVLQVVSYGPLFIPIAKLVCAPGLSLLGKLLAWRAFCASLYIGLVLALRALRLPPRIWAIAAVNPGLMLQYVSTGHNDIVAIVLLVAGAALMPFAAVFGFGGIVLAALIKLPYALLGLPLVARVRPLWVRLAGLAGAAAAVVIGSWVGGGQAYVDALRGYAAWKTAPVPPVLTVTASGVVVLLLVVAMLGYRRRLRSAAWLMRSLTPWLFSWYLIWGLPYALGRRRATSYLLVLFPFVAMLFESSFLRVWEVKFVLPAVVALAIFAPNKRFTLGSRPPARVRRRHAKRAGKN